MQQTPALLVQNTLGRVFMAANVGYPEDAHLRLQEPCSQPPVAPISIFTILFPKIKNSRF